MKLNWGTGIAAFYTLFAGTMIFFVFKSTHYDHSLVRDDYYQGDLEYQQHFDKVTNDQADSPLRIEHKAGETVVRLHLNDASLSDINGDVHFFRPSTAKMDVHLPLEFNAEGIQEIATDELLPGLWRLKVDWTANGQGYYTEVQLVL
jgi:nitrogen fixation protein FixH